MFHKKVKAKAAKLKLIRDVRRFSVIQLVVFVLVFASIGSYFVFHGFALICACAVGPTTPSNLTAAAASNSQINLNWTGSTESGYNGGFYYHVYRNGTQIDVVTSASWADTGLSAGTTYSYYVVAYDTYGNVSSPSNTASATTLATAPAAPTSLGALTISNTEIDLSWTGSPAANTYWIFRNGSVINSTSATSYKDTGLLPGTTYSYFITASNAYGYSADSNTATMTTSGAKLPVPPAAPTNLTAAPVSSTQINLSWLASSQSGSSGGGYGIYRNGTRIDVVTSTSWSDTGLAAGTTYSYYVTAFSTAGDESGPSNTATATTQSIPLPAAPSGLSAEMLDDSEIDLSWTASSSGGISSYNIYRNGSFIGNTSSATASDTGSPTAYYDSGLASATTYSYYVVAVNSSGITSGPSNTVASMTQSTTPPSAPTNFKATVTSASTVSLSWTGSSLGQVGIKEYDIYEVTPPDNTDDNGVLDGNMIGSTTGTSYPVSGLSASTDYGFYVIAVDITGNFGEESTEALATTNAPGYAINVSLSASVTDIGNNTTGTVLTWTANPGNVTCAKKFDTDGSALDTAWTGSFSGLTGGAQTVYPPSSSTDYTFYSYELSCTNGVSTAVSGIDVRVFSDNISSD